MKRIVIGDFGTAHRKKIIESLVGKAWDEVKVEAEARMKAPDVVEAFCHNQTLELPRYEMPRLGRGSHRKWPVPKQTRG